MIKVPMERALQIGDVDIPCMCESKNPSLVALDTFATPDIPAFHRVRIKYWGNPVSSASCPKCGKTFTVQFSDK
jgi:hypothetical protein